MVDKKYITLVVLSPLIALWQDQVAAMTVMESFMRPTASRNGMYSSYSFKKLLFSVNHFS